jgi:serine-type D-Ala-D-Ala carboxypeptidase/endopeptidase
VILRVRIEGGNAKAQLTGQGEIEIYPQARDEFFYRIVEATLKFTRDASGKVVSVTLFQSGREIPGKKIK